MESLSTIGSVLPALGSAFAALGTGAIVGIVIGGLALVIIMWIVSMYNGLVALKNRVKKATLLADARKPVPVAQSKLDEIGLDVLDLSLPARAPD